MKRLIASTRLSCAALGMLLLLPGCSLFRSDRAVAMARPMPAAPALMLAQTSVPVPIPAVAMLRKPAGPLPNGLPLATLYRDPAPMVVAFLAQAEPARVPVETRIPPVVVPEPIEISAAASPDAQIAIEQALAPAAPAAPAAHATGEAESLRDAIVSSLKSNPDIQIALAKQDDARFGVDEARAGYLPHLDVTVGYGPEITRQGSVPGAWNNRLEGSLTLNQNVWDFGTTTNDIKRARAAYRAAQWSTREQIESISYDIATAYLGMLQQQKLLDMGNEELIATQKILRMVTVQKDLGLTTQADVDRAKARTDNIQSTLLDRDSVLQQAREAYRRLTDRLPGRAVDLPSAANALPQSAETATDMIDDHSPRMAQAVEDRRSLARQYASQTGTFFPRIGVQVQGNHKYDVMGQTGLVQDARAMVTMSYRFLNGGADLALRNRIGARLRQADYELERRRREVEQDIRVDFQSLTAARQKIATISSEIGSAQRVADLYKQQFREGKRSVFDLLDSQQVLFNARSNALANEIAMNLAEYRVLQKLGGLFDLVSGSEPLPELAVPAPVKLSRR